MRIKDGFKILPIVKSCDSISNDDNISIFSFPSDFTKDWIKTVKARPSYLSHYFSVLSI
jgi:hypothetical protein